MAGATQRQRRPTMISTKSEGLPRSIKSIWLSSRSTSVVETCALQGAKDLVLTFQGGNSQNGMVLSNRPRPSYSRSDLGSSWFKISQAHQAWYLRPQPRANDHAPFPQPKLKRHSAFFLDMPPVHHRCAVSEDHEERGNQVMWRRRCGEEWNVTGKPRAIPNGTSLRDGDCL